MRAGHARTDHTGENTKGEKMGTIIGDGITFDDVLLVPQYSEVTPNMSELFYQYRMTGIYPKEQYFEIPAAELYSLEEVIEENRRRAEKAATIRSAKRKDYSQSGNNEKRDALSVVRKDIIKLLRRIRQLKRQASDLKILIEKAEACI